MTDLDDGLVDQVAVSTPDAQTAAAEPAAAQNHFASVYEFVDDLVAQVYARPTRAQSAFRWCSTWWNHPEAVARLTACWKAFEVLRQDPGTGASLWWRDHLDPCMAALTTPDGPFAGCSEAIHKLPPRLPTADPPEWLLTGAVTTSP